MKAKTFGRQLAIMLTVALVTSPVFIYSDYADAKGFKSSGGFKSSSFKSSSFKSYSSKPKTTKTTTSPFSSKPKPTPVANKPAPAPKAKPKPVSASTRGMNRTQLASKQATSKQAFSASQAKFKKPTSSTTSATSTTNTSFVRGATRSNDYGTYYARRDNYYRGYSAPTYVYAGSPSYGMWDTVFLYYMLSNASHASNFGYHHANDPGYQEWRRQAEIQAQHNAELKSQLAAMDAKISGMSGERDPNYIPPGTDADLALAANLVEANRPKLRLCTGEPDGTYVKMAAALRRSVTAADIVPVATTGSVQNLEKMNAGECDAAFVQDDAYWSYYAKNEGKVDFNLTRMPVQGYRETAHLICNAGAEIGNIDDLTSQNTVYLGEEGSGASVTWDNFLTEDEELGRVKTAYATRQEIGRNLETDKNACLLYVGAINNERVKRFDNLGGSLEMADISSGDFLKVQNPAGRAVYATQHIDGKTYAGLRDKSLGGMWEWDIDTLTVGADFALSDAWAKANGSLSERVLKQVSETTLSAKALNQ